MNIVKWLSLWALLFPLTGCATLSQSNFDNVFEENPNISPDELPVALKQKPIENTQINSSFSYQVYDLGLWGTKGHKAIYFKDGKMIGQAPYKDNFSNLDTLLSFGAITQKQHDDPCGTHVPGFVDLGCGCGMPGDAGCGCGQPGPSGCDNQCGSTKVDNGCGCGSTETNLGCGCGNSGPSGCDNQCGSSAMYDACGVCGGNGSSCASALSTPP